MIVNPPSEWMKERIPTSTRQAPDKRPTCSATIPTLVETLAAQQLSVKEILAIMNLKNRQNFMVNYLNPAIKEGIATKLYPAKPRHPSKKYLLTVKESAAYHADLR